MAEERDTTGKKGRRTWRWLAWALVLVLAVELAGFLLVPPLVRSQLESRLSGALHRATRVKQVRVNPLTLALSVEGLTVSEPDGTHIFLSCGRIFLDLDAASLPTLTLRVAELRVEEPYARLAFTGNGTANFSDLLAGQGEGEGAAPAGSGGGVGLPVVLRSLAVERGHFVVEDQVLGKRHEVRDFNLAIPFASSLPADSTAYVEPSLSAEVNGRPLRLRGRALPFTTTRRTEFDFGLEDADLAEYWAYAPVPAGLALTSGRLSCNASVVLEQTRGLLPLLFVRGGFHLRDLALAGVGGGQLASLDGLDFDLARFSLLERRLDLDRVAVRGLHVNFTRGTDGSLDWAGLVPADAPVEAAPTPGPPFVVSCARLDLEQGAVRFTDRAAPGGFAARLDNLSLHADNATTGPGKARFDLAAQGAVGLAVTGSLSLEPLELDASVSLSGLNLPSLAPYLGDALPARVAAGAAGLSGQVRYGSKGLSLSSLDLAVSGPALALPGAAEPFLRLDRLALSGAGLDLSGRAASAASLRLEGGMLKALRREDGTVDLAGLAAAGHGGEGRGTGGKPAGPAWDVRLARAEVAGLGVEFLDLATGPQARLALSSLDVSLENLGLDLARPVPLRLAAELRPGGKVSVDGSLVPAGPAFQGRVQAAGLPLPLARPWLPKNLAVRPERGSLTLAGDLDLAAGREFTLDFTGGAELRGLGLAAQDRRDAASLDLARVAGLRLGLPGDRVRADEVELEEVVLPDPGGERPALSLGRLRARGLDLDLAARVAALDSLVLAAPAAWLERTPGGMNLARVLRSLAGEPGGEAASAPAAEPFTLRLNLVRVFGGAVGFRDATLAPAVTLRLARLGGRGEHLSTVPGERGTLSLNATVEQHAPLLLSGDLAPEADGLDVSGVLSLTGLDLAPLNPYLIAYTGYPADTGKLDAALDLAVSGGSLAGENRILVRGLELGPRDKQVKDPAVPIELAMSLLADSSGNLSLDIPITGRLDDPQFNLGKVIASAITGMVGKLVTAPFSFLGSVFSLMGGQSPKAGAVPFAPGSAALGPEAREALTAVAQALAERPRLEVTVGGVAVPGTDGPGLKEALFLQKLKVRKFRDLKRKRQGPARPEEVEIAPDEYERWLTEAYESEPMDKPRNFLGLARKQPREAMERMLRAAVTAGDQELLDLAAERANAAQEFLLATGAPGDRVFARAPALAEGGEGMVKLGLR